MAVTLFWRCEDITLDGTHDFTAADNTALANGTPAIGAAAALVGSNGIVVDSATDAYRFSPTSLISPTVGSAALLFRFPTTVSGAGQTFFWSRGAASANDFIQIDMQASQEVRLAIRNASAGLVGLTTTGVNVAAGAIYGVVIRWDQPNNDRRIEVYDGSGTLIEAQEDLATAYTAPADLGFSNGIHFGDIGGFSQTCHIDNVFIADTYNEPLQDNLFITSWTEYGVGGGGVSTQNLFYRRRR